MTDQAGSKRSSTLELERDSKAGAGPAGDRSSNGDTAHHSAVRSARVWAALRLRELAEAFARAIVVLTATVVAIIALGVLFKVLDANTGKWIVSTVEDLAKALASPFDQMFTPHSAKLSVAVNWGIALAVYAFAGRVLARALMRAAEQPGMAGR